MRTNRSRHKRQPSGAPVRITERDLVWAEVMHRHGYSTVYHLHEFTKHRWPSLSRSKHRIGQQLFHDLPFFDRIEQFRLTLEYTKNDILYDVADLALDALQHAGRLHDSTPKRSSSAPHDAMVSLLTQSIHIGTLRCGIRFMHHDEVVAAIGTDQFELQVESKRSIWNPDALFGLQFPSGARYHAIEADRKSEVVATDNFQRKSMRKQIMQARTFIGRGLYKEIFPDGTPLLLLWVFSSERRMRSVMEMLDRETDGKGCNYILFRTFPEFNGYFSVPRPKPEFFTGPWLRVRRDPFHLSSS